MGFDTQIAGRKWLAQHTEQFVSAPEQKKSGGCLKKAKR
jgi:hypothetical protein